MFGLFKRKTLVKNQAWWFFVTRTLHKTRGLLHVLTPAVYIRLMPD